MKELIPNQRNTRLSNKLFSFLVRVVQKICILTPGYKWLNHSKHINRVTVLTYWRLNPYESYPQEQLAWNRGQKNAILVIYKINLSKDVSCIMQTCYLSAYGWFNLILITMVDARTSWCMILSSLRASLEKRLNISNSTSSVFSFSGSNW